MHRTIPLSIAICLAAAACHHAKQTFDYTTPEPAAAPKANTLCDGEPYLEVNNRGNQAVDIYARIAGGPAVYIGTASPSTSRVTLAGTAAENKTAFFIAQVGGKDIPTSMPGAPVTITRRCDKRG